MEMLFGDICSANRFQADKELHAELGIKDPEAEESQRSTPSPPRNRAVYSTRGKQNEYKSQLINGETRNATQESSNIKVWAQQHSK
jgi:hypothetical protein